MKITNKKNVSKTFGMRQSGIESLDYLRRCDNDVSASEFVNRSLELYSHIEKLKTLINHEIMNMNEVKLKVKNEDFYYTIKIIPSRCTLPRGVVYTYCVYLDESLYTETRSRKPFFANQDFNKCLKLIPLHECELVK